MGIICVAIMAAAMIATPANGSVPPPTRKLDCYTGAPDFSYFWGFVKILPERRYWASDSVWAGEGKGTGRLKPLQRRRFKVVSGPLRTMIGRWFYFKPGKVAIRFTFGGSNNFNDKECGPGDG